MESNIRRILSLTSPWLIGLFPVFSLAALSAYTNKCNDVVIENETASTVLSDNERCSAAWVLPPSAGKASFSGFAASGNLSFCSQLKSTVDSGRIISRKMNELDERLDEVYAEKEKKKKKKVMLEVRAKRKNRSKLPEYVEYQENHCAG